MCIQKWWAKLPQFFEKNYFFYKSSKFPPKKIEMRTYVQKLLTIPVFLDIHEGSQNFTALAYHSHTKVGPVQFSIDFRLRSSLWISFMLYSLYIMKLLLIRDEGTLEFKHLSFQNFNQPFFGKG